MPKSGVFRSEVIAGAPSFPCACGEPARCARWRHRRDGRADAQEEQ